MDLGRHQVKTEESSGIVNDPNDWSREVERPRYIGLLARIVTVRFETMQIVDSLPAPPSAPECASLKWPHLGPY